MDGVHVVGGMAAGLWARVWGKSSSGAQVQISPGRDLGTKSPRR